MKRFSALAIVFLALCAACILLMRSCGGDRREAVSTPPPPVTEPTPEADLPEMTPTPVYQPTPEPTPSVEGRVWTTSDVNLRRSPGTDGEIVVAVDKETELYRTGITDSGWSIVEWEDSLCYVSSDYLSTVHPHPENDITPCEETVWATDAVNLRRGAGKDFEAVGSVDKDAELTRTGVSANGWSRVRWYDGEFFILSEYLTTVRPEAAGGGENGEPGFSVIPCQDTVWTTDGMNLRRGPGKDFDVAVTVDKNTELQRTGLTEDGWSRVLYNSVGYYVSSEYLTTVRPAELDEVEPTPEPEEEEALPAAEFETSGEFSSDTGVSLNLIVRWNVADRSDGTRALTLSAFLSSATLQSASYADNLCFKVGNDTFNLTAPEINVESGTLTETALGNCTAVVEQSNVPVTVSWRFGGTYSGQELDTVTASANLVLGS